MSQGLPSTWDMLSEYADADLGDPRRLERLLQAVELMSAAPEVSFARMTRDEAEREGLYRFLRNSRFEWQQILAPHQRETAARALEAGRVLAIHDTTEFALADDAELESYLRPSRKGFLGHLSLVADARHERRPLGVVGLELVERAQRKARTKKNGRRLSGNETAKLENREYDRWLRGVNVAEQHLQGMQVTHVMDAEGDSYGLLSKIHDAGFQFVVRVCHDRRAKTKNDCDWSRLREVMKSAKTFKRRREVHISQRKATRAPRGAKLHPSRDARTAELEISFQSMEWKRPHYVEDSSDYLSVTVVRAREISPPEGAKPIDWLIVTNLKISTKTDAELVIDTYRQRWLIEEYFKALKTGCAFRKRKLTNPYSIVNSLAMLAPIAWRALLLRQIARSATSGVNGALTEPQLQVLHAKFPKLPRQPSASDALVAVASMGGYRKSKAPPGWLAIIRGLEKLESMAEGWMLRDVITR